METRVPIVTELHTLIIWLGETVPVCLRFVQVRPHRDRTS